MGRPVLFLFCALLVTYVYGSPTPVVYDTIVVGLGASGTAAATTLAKAGKKVLALEAQDRIGGRVYTVPFGDKTIELGAEWVHGIVNSSTYELAVKNNVSILPQETYFKVYRSDGSSDKKDLIIELTDYVYKLMDDLQTSEPDSVGHVLTKRIREYITEKHPSIQNDEDFITNYLNVVDFIVNTYNCALSWNDVTTQSQYKHLEGFQDMSWHTYGYKTLFEILLNKYHNGSGYPTLEIRLNAEVTHIRWSQDPEDNVVVTTKDGSTYTAKNVVVTVSIGVLKERYATLFSPALPDVKIRAVQAISMGTCNKLVFRFPEAWWPEDSFGLWVWRDEDKASVSKDDQWLLKINTPGSPMSSNTTLTLWVCAESAKKVETLSDEVVSKKVMGLIRRFMGVGKTIPEPIQFVKTSWYSNPFTRGSYTYDNMDTPQHPTVRADLAQPLLDTSGTPRVLFAGEATDTMHFATVHGALDSGFREANQLLSAGSK